MKKTLIILSIFAASKANAELCKMSFMTASDKNTCKVIDPNGKDAVFSFFLLKDVIEPDSKFIPLSQCKEIKNWCNEGWLAIVAEEQSLLSIEHKCEASWSGYHLSKLWDDTPKGDCHVLYSNKNFSGRKIKYMERTEASCLENACKKAHRYFVIDVPKHEDYRKKDKDRKYRGVR